MRYVACLAIAAMLAVMSSCGGKDAGLAKAVEEINKQVENQKMPGIEKMSLMPDAEPVEFKLDRPFFYYVTSPDGVVLFVGVLYNPNL